MKPVDKDERKVANIYQAEFQPWVMENGELHDSSVLQLDTSKIYPDDVTDTWR